MRFAVLGSRGYPSTYGGYETLVRHLAPHLVAHGHDVTVYCRARENTARSWLVDGVECVWTPGLESSTLSTLSFGLTATVDASRRRFDAVLVLNIANGFWFPALRASGTPFAVNTDGVEWERGKWSRLGRGAFRAGARMTARHADELISDSVVMGRMWEQIYGRCSTYIPYGAPVLDSPGNDRLLPLGLADRPYLLVVARLVPENNVELILDALDRLGGGAPHAVVVGSAGWDAPIETRLRARSADGTVQWLGHVDDQMLLSQLWANSAVYVHGHSVGGTNPALLQALGAGAPTLALDTAFNAEVLPDREQLFAPDTDALADRIRLVTGCEATRRRLSRRGRAIVGERYRWNDVCDAYMTLLARLGARRRSGSQPAAPLASRGRPAISDVETPSPVEREPVSVER